MIFLVVLATSTTVAAAALSQKGAFELRAAARLGLAAAMVFAGVSHLLMPLPFLQHVPEFLPAREAIVLLTGVAEAALGIGLLARPPWRRRVGLALAIYLVAVFPANVYVAATGVDVDGQPGGLYQWLRLPLQLLFIGWSVWSTRTRSADEVIDVPQTIRP